MNYRTILCAAFMLIPLAYPAETTNEAEVKKEEEKSAGHEISLNGTFENGKRSPWAYGNWRSGGGKPAVYGVAPTKAQSNGEGSQASLSMKISGDSKGKRTSIFVYVDIPFKAEGGNKFTLSFDALGGPSKFSMYHYQIMAFNGKKFAFNLPAVKGSVSKPGMKEEEWVSTSSTFEIPADKADKVSKLHVRISMITDKSNPDTVYESFIDNIRLIQQ